MPEDNEPALLVSDAEREQGIALLRDPVAEGRLTLEEFSERVGSAQLARTEPELAALVADLPAEPKAAALTTPAVKYRPSVRSSYGPARGSWRSERRSAASSARSTSTCARRRCVETRPICISITCSARGP